MDGVLGSSWGMYISVKVHVLRYAMQVGCGRLGMHSIIGICGPLWWTEDRWAL